MEGWKRAQQGTQQKDHGSLEQDAEVTNSFCCHEESGEGFLSPSAFQGVLGTHTQGSHETQRKQSHLQSQFSIISWMGLSNPHIKLSSETLAIDKYLYLYESWSIIFFLIALIYTESFKHPPNNYREPICHQEYNKPLSEAVLPGR